MMFPLALYGLPCSEASQLFVHKL
ncbi:hypothetical protein KL86CIT2_20042 [uncultured Citrobacter sp.]|uniref:Uncharacterized protein n=1 Tax=uncultured Citrobacter sp. TaxID=200446 RepID=A0A212I591_9ENTR|nr:hypothetical protein KL86CIT2_20042 [uncultured Citrobacter sp.]